MKNACRRARLLSLLLLGGLFAQERIQGQEAPPPGAAMSVAEAQQIVTRSYEKILKRLPDPSGMDNFVKYLTEGGKDERWVREALKASPEYLERVKFRKKDLVNFSIIAVIVAVVGGILFFPRK